MMAGQAVGFTRLVLAFVYPAPPCGQDDNRIYFLKIHFLYVAAMETGVSLVFMVAISLFTQKRAKSKVRFRFVNVSF